LMQHINDHKSGYLFDPFGFLGEKRRRLLDQGWPGVFRTHLLERLPVEKIAEQFNKRMGRPSKELYTVLGALALQEMQDLTDVETVDAVAFDIRWHYALDIVRESDQEKYVSERSLRNYRRNLIELDLAKDLFEETRDGLLKAFNVSGGKQRLDSTLILSNMKALRRLELFVEVIRRFLKNLRRQQKALFEEEVEEEVRERYLREGKGGYFAQVKPSERKRVLREAAKDLLRLVERFRENEAVTRLLSYRQMERVLREQCEVVEGKEEKERVRVKEPKDVPSDCLQNPTDPDAAYDAHKGVGYQVQIMETYEEDDGEDEPGGSKKPKPPDLITYVEVEPANRSDADALMPAIQETKKGDCAPEKLLADTSYGSDENVEAAKGEGVNVTSPPPSFGTKKGGLSRKDFEWEGEDKTPCVCPAGHSSNEIRRTMKGDFKVFFDHDQCSRCEHREHCPIQITKRTAYLKYTEKQARLAKRRKHEKTEAFADAYRWRAGVEGTMSRYKSQTGAGRLRVRGLQRVRYRATMKAAGLNILRAGKAMAAKSREKQPSEKVSEQYSLFSGLAEICRRIKIASREFPTRIAAYTPPLAA
jgi:hypothetical protein